MGGGVRIWVARLDFEVAGRLWDITAQTKMNTLQVGGCRAALKSN